LKKPKNFVSWEDGKTVFFLFSAKVEERRMRDKIAWTNLRVVGETTEKEEWKVGVAH
jgi:hypothetical protein